VKTDWKRTWQAITALPTDHFPLLLPGVHKLAAFFILRRLKKLGYSNCRVDNSNKGLIVYAQR
jgi:hypothetical protein